MGHHIPEAGPESTVSSGHCPCRACAGQSDHDDWNTEARGETRWQRADRAYSEVLQEIRVAQTGVQILFAFLLTLAFTSRFRDVTVFQRGVYTVALLLAAGATALLIAPTAFHRLSYRQRRKPHLANIASRLAIAGLAVLLLAIVTVLLLILDVVLGLPAAAALTTAMFCWFVAWWFLGPLRVRLRAATVAQTSAAHPDGAHPDGAHPDGAHPDGAHPDGTHPDGEAARMPLARQ